MRNTFYVLLSTLLIAPQVLLAQTGQEGFIYSTLNRQGTARSMALGNALGSVGGDFSSINVNPAGLGIYRRGEVTFTTALKVGGSQSVYQGVNTSENYSNFGLQNLGLVAAGKATGSRNWKGVGFGIGLSRIADFNRAYSYKGQNFQSSQSEAFAYDANVNSNEFWSGNGFYNPSPAWLGYNTYLVDTFGSNATFTTVVDYTKGLNQQNTVSTRGGINEFSLALGGNYNEKLMLGVSIGIPIMRFNRLQQFSEKSLSSDVDYFDNYTYNEQLRTRGTGLNLKLGAIVAPIDEVRIGASFHTPTYYSLNESFESSLTANTENFAGIQSRTANTNTFEYDVVTPYRAVLSGTVFFGKAGFFTLDYEYTDMGATKFILNTSANEEAFGVGAFTQRQNEINKEIKDTYKGVSTLRGGVEFRFDNVMVRAGGAYGGSPYKKAETFQTARIDITGGIGYRSNKFFIDLGYMHTNLRQPDVAYVIPYSNGIISAPKAEIKHGLNTFAVTIGTKF